MEISRRHLESLERAEVRQYAPEDITITFTNADGEVMPDPFADVFERALADGRDQLTTAQKQLAGMTRNQRRVYKKLLRKAAKRK